MSDHFIAPWDLQEEPVDECYGPPSPINGQQNEIANGGNPFADNGAAQEDKKALVNDVINSVVNELNSGDVLNEGEDQGSEEGVQPSSGGEGLPYAPVNWPSQGDNWTWRVGKRINAAGFFQDRFLYPPKHFPKVSGARPPFASLNAVTAYIRTVFPDADIDAFFSSFTWKVPGRRVSPWTEPIVISSPKPSLGDGAKEEVQVEGEGSRLRKRKPKAPTPPPPSPPPPRQKRPRGGAKSSGTKQKATKDKTAAPSSSAAKRKTRHTAKQTVPVPFADEDDGNNTQAEEFNIPIPEDFDNYLNTLEDIIAQPFSDSIVAAQSTAMTRDSPPVDDDELAEARHRLSTLLVMDFPTLVSSKNFSELPALAAKLRNDPRLSAEQLVKLKLIEEISSFREVFLDSREIIDQIDKQYGTLEANKAKVASLKSEYSELKDKTDQLQAQIDGNLSTVQDIDNEIARLQARRAELIDAVESNKAAKVEVSYAQKMVASAIPNVVHEIQVSNAKIPEWDLKRSNAVKREAEILAKFAPLEGFSLIPPPFQGLFL